MKRFMDERPWGRFLQFTHNEQSTVKILEVKPGQRLSLQYHHHRTEFWYVISGHPIVTIGDDETIGKPGDEFVIDYEQKHRLAAPDDGPVQIIEIAMGTFDEDDNIRLEDDYDRPSPGQES